jgi:hypothetical protein
MIAWRMAGSAAWSGRINAEAASPGAIATNTNTRTVIPKKTGMLISRRRTMKVPMVLGT